MKHIPKYTPTEVLNDPTDLLTKKCRKSLERIKQKPYIPNCINNPLAKKIYQYQLKKSIKVTILKSMFMN